MWSVALLFIGTASLASASEDLAVLVGQPADIAPSAYQYRADRKAEENQPESWLALMRYARMPLNKPLDVNAAAIKQALYGLLWEEIRPVHQVELTWAANAGRRPAPEELVMTTLDNQGSASSWWNNLSPVKQAVTPTVSADGRTYLYDLKKDTCGLVVSVGGTGSASDYEVPAVRVLVADTWKKMDIEVEWGFDPTTAEKDYSGRVETYDGRVAGLRPLDGDARTTVVGAGSWRSVGKGPARRGLKLSLLYMGTSKWRGIQPFTSQADDVARTIVTLWTRTGNFSFLAADLENGPILAPEYGFFVRRTPESAPSSEKPATRSRTVTPSQPPVVLASQATSAGEFIQELQARKQSTIRQQTRAHEEQTWEGAVTAMRGDNLPPHPTPPAGSEPAMQVQVPSERLTAQWNLGAWHLVRHCEKNPNNGRCVV